MFVLSRVDNRSLLKNMGFSFLSFFQMISEKDEEILTIIVRWLFPVQRSSFPDCDHIPLLTVSANTPNTARCEPSDLQGVRGV